MKTLLALLTLTVCSLFTTAQKTWLGTGGNKLWNNGANWSPAGAPGSLDNVIVNITDSVEVNQAVNINSLTITNNASVIFNVTTTSRTITISSTSTTQLGLLINAGSTLTAQANITGTSTLSLTLALTGGIGVSGEIYGSLIFKSVGGGTGGSNTRLETFTGALSYAQLKVKNGGLIRYNEKSGNSSSAGSPTNTITMENGSTYWIDKNGGSFPDGAWAAGSLCRTTGMVLNGPSFNGNIYGNLEWNNPSQSPVFGFNKNLTFNNVTLINANGNELRVKSGGAASSFTLTINGNLDIAAGITLETSGNTVVAPNGGEIELKGNLINNGLLSETGPSGTTDTISFSGITPQTISGIGSVANQLTFKIDNATGVTLNSPLTLPHHLFLNNGIITTTTANLLTLQSGCSFSSPASTWYTNLNMAGYTNFGTETSYVVGPIRKLGLSGASRWAFPVGSATQFRPAFLFNATGDFTAEYKQANPRSVYGTTYGAGLDHISAIEYWLIDGASSPTASVELSFYDPNSGGVTVMGDLRVARFNGSQWDNEGITATVGTAGSNGSVTGNSITTFSPFTLASSTPANPLPLNTITLNATKQNAQVKINWQVNADEDVQEYFVEKSSNGRTFTPIHTTTALRRPVATSYQVTDAGTNKNILYRVKAVKRNVGIIYSETVLVPGAEQAVTVYPNPATHILNIQLAQPGVQLAVYNATGKQVYRATVNNNVHKLDVQQWPKGWYRLQVLPGIGTVPYSESFMVQ